MLEDNSIIGKVENFTVPFFLRNVRQNDFLTIFFYIGPNFCNKLMVELSNYHLKRIFDVTNKCNK